MNPSSQYTNGEYATKNPSYHAEDSLFKWGNFARCLREVGNEPTEKKITSVVEIGCGAGGIIRAAQTSGLFPNARFEGWDINPYAIELARKASTEVSYVCGDLLKTDKHYDIIICADVFEHIEDNFSFLKNLRKHGERFLFNIPLEISLLTTVRGPRVLEQSFEAVGHVHFYTKPSALQLLKVCGYSVVHTQFARNRTARFDWKRTSLRSLLATIPQIVLDRVAPDVSAALLGDSLVVYAR